MIESFLLFIFMIAGGVGLILDGLLAQFNLHISFATGVAMHETDMNNALIVDFLLLLFILSNDIVICRA